MKIKALRERRKTLAAKARNLLDQNPGDSWNDDLQAEYDGIVTDIGRVDSQIENEQRQLDIEATDIAAASRIDGPGSPGAGDGGEGSRVLVGAFNSWLRGGAAALTPEQRTHMAEETQRIYGTMSTGTGSEGGYLVPTENAAVLLEAMAAYGGMRQVATVQPTTDGHPIEWPTVDETSQEGELVAENAAVAAQDLVVGTKTIGAYKYSSKSVAVPFELIQDSSVDLVAYINRALGDRLGRVTNRHFTVGTGAGQPNGAVTASAQGSVAAAVAAVAYDDLVDLEHSVDPSYRAAGQVGYMFHDQTLKALKKLKDADGRPLWVPGVAVSEPDTISGYGYTINQHMPLMGANNKSMLFGDFSKYLIRDVMQILLFRLTDSAFTLKGQVGFVAFSRHDGDLIDATSNALRHLVHPAV